MKVKYLLPVAIAGILAGCTTVSTVSEEGATEEAVFPDVQKATLKNGTYPNLENVRNVQSGVNRDQIYDLIGRPHFSEGFSVREWDYLFHFRTEEGIQTCQFKVLFDKDKVARNFHWAPESCADIVNPKAPIEPTSFVLDADVTFAFDSAELTDLGYDEVNKIAYNLKQQELLEEIVVGGHSDRIGSVEYNDNLSLARAETVREALINEGISGSVIETVGYGKSQPLVECDYTQTAELINCLAPNRRVEIKASGLTSN